jgi:predicted PurR-regulated permease PerM
MKQKLNKAGCIRKGSILSKLILCILLCILLFVLGISIGIIHKDSIIKLIKYDIEISEAENAKMEQAKNVNSNNIVENPELRESGTMSNQLLERIKDACSSFQALLALLSIIVVVIGMALGIGIFRADAYASRLIDKLYYKAEKKLNKHLKENKTELEKFYDKTKKDMQNIRDEHIRTLQGVILQMPELFSEEEPKKGV